MVIGSYVMKIEYRKATNADSEAIALLAVQMWASHTVEDLSNGFSSLMKSDNNALFLLIINGTIQGFAQCGLRHKQQSGRIFRRNFCTRRISKTRPCKTAFELL